MDLLAMLGREDQTVLATVHLEGVALVDLAGKYLERQGILDLALDDPLERTSAEIGVIAHLGQVLAGRLRDFEMVALVRQQLADAAQLDGNDRGQLVPFQGME